MGAPQISIGTNATVQMLRSTAIRIQALETKARQLEASIKAIVSEMAPGWLAKTGIGPLSAALVLVSWWHPGRIRSEAAFASLAGVCPIEAQSGLTGHRCVDRSDQFASRALVEAWL